MSHCSAQKHNSKSEYVEYSLAINMNTQTPPEQKPWPLIYLALAWISTIVGTLGSLYFSEIAQYPPCTLCWYQRICMYPLVAILAVAIIKRDRLAYQYALPFSMAGLSIALYHNLLYYNVIPEKAAPCVTGVSCTTRYIQLFGFMDIPLMGGITFLGITLLLLFFRKSIRTSH